MKVAKQKSAFVVSLAAAILPHLLAAIEGQSPASH
jgi:hypothetical protein